MRPPISTQCQWQVQFGHRSCRSVQLGGGGAGRRSVSFGGGRSSSAGVLRPPRVAPIKVSSFSSLICHCTDVEATTFSLSVSSAAQTHSPDLSLIPPLRSLSSPPLSPWLLVPINMSEQTEDLPDHYPYCFVSLADNKIFKPSQRRLPWDDEFFFPDGTKFCGSSPQGWVLIKHPRTQEMYLINPLSASDSAVVLPLVYTLENDLVGGSVTKSYDWGYLYTEFVCARDVYDYIPPEERKWEYNHYVLGRDEFSPKFAMSSVPSDPTCTVAMQYGLLAFWKPGQEYWTPLDVPDAKHDPYFAYSIIYSRIHQCFFALDSDGNVDACKWDSDSPRPQITSHLEVPTPRPFPKGDIECERYSACRSSSKWKRSDEYLVESSFGDLLMVEIFSLKDEEDDASEDDQEEEASEDDENDNPELQFFVFKLNFEKIKWEHVTTLGGSSLFICNHYALCAPVGDCPELKPNCIYFTGNVTCVVQSLPYTGVVFNMEDATNHPFSIPSDKRGSSVWLLPNPNSV